MSTVQLVIVCVTVIVLSVVVVGALAARGRVPDDDSIYAATERGNRVIVFLESQSVEGVVLDVDAAVLTLTSAVVRTPGADDAPLGGLVRIPARTATALQELVVPELAPSSNGRVHA